METISIKFVMNRLLDNPVMANLKLSSAATYLKDLCSIVNLVPLTEEQNLTIDITNYSVRLPAGVSKHNIIGIELVDASGEGLDKSKSLNPALFENNKLSANLKSSRVINTEGKTFYTYEVKGDILHLDNKTATVRITYKDFMKDELGFPVIPYDGSLMQAVENYIKYRYFTILHENDMISYQKVQHAEREYSWYIGQYTEKANMPTYDEAVAWANSWQRLIEEKNLDLDSEGIREIFNA